MQGWDHPRANSVGYTRNMPFTGRSQFSLHQHNHPTHHKWKLELAFRLREVYLPLVHYRETESSAQSETLSERVGHIHQLYRPSFYLLCTVLSRHIFLGGVEWSCSCYKRHNDRAAERSFITHHSGDRPKTGPRPGCTNNNETVVRSDCGANDSERPTYVSSVRDHTS